MLVEPIPTSLVNTTLKQQEEDMKENIQQLSLWSETVVKTHASVKRSRKETVNIDPHDKRRTTHRRQWAAKINQLYKFLYPALKQIWAIFILFVVINLLHLPPDVMSLIIHK